MSGRLQSNRTPLADAAAMHSQSVAALAEVPDRLAQEHGENELRMGLRLNLLPAILQYALDSHTTIEEHVCYQSLERLMLEAFGLEALMPPERYANLAAFERMQHAMFHSACTQFMHGQGFQADRARAGAMPLVHDRTNPATFLFFRNSGQHARSTIMRSLPAADAHGGPQLNNLLNFFELVLRNATRVTFAPTTGCTVTFVDMAMDGLSLGAGAMVDEHELKLVGFETPVGYRQAKRILEMDDAERIAWLKEVNPLVTSALHFMLTTSDDSVSGHIGTAFVPSEGDHKLAARRISEMLSFTRICYSCLERAWYVCSPHNLPPQPHLCIDSSVCHL